MAKDEVLNANPPLKLKAFVDDIELHLCGTNQEVPRAVDETRQAKLKLSLTEEGKERKSKLIVTNKCWESGQMETFKDVGIGISDSVKYLGIEISSQRKKLEKKKKEKSVGRELEQKNSGRRT